MKTAIYLNFILLAGLIIFSIVVWNELPDKIPSNFDIEGNPDSYMDKIVWIALPLLALVLTVLMYLSTKLVTKYPGLMNIPKKKDFFKLPKNEQLPILHYFNGFIVLTAVPMNAIFFTIQVGIYEVAVEKSTSLGWQYIGIMIAALVGMTVMTIIFYVRISKTIKMAIEEPEKTENIYDSRMQDLYIRRKKG